jgi:hypothetical protein
MKVTIEWIPVEASLPDDESTVLMALSDGEVWTGFRDAGDWRFVSAALVDESDGTRVTHWAEFPDPPNNKPHNNAKIVKQ